MNIKEINRYIDTWIKESLRSDLEHVTIAWLGPSAKQSDVTKAKVRIQKRIEKLK